MTDFPPIRPGVVDFGAANPALADPNVIAYIPTGSIGNDKLAYGLDPRKVTGYGLKAYRSTTQSVNDASQARITFDTVVFNQGFQAPGATFSNVTIPFSGIYLLDAIVEFAANSTGTRVAAFELNADTLFHEGVRLPATPGGTWRASTVAIRKLAAGDIVGIRVLHSGGAPINVSAGEDNCALTVLFLFAL